MKLLKFNQYISENRDLSQQEAEAAELGKAADRINRLVTLGLVDDAGYRREYVRILDSYRKMVKGLKLDLKDAEDLEILKRLGTMSGVTSIRGLESEGAKALFAKGLHMVSSPTQLINGSLVFSLDPEYRRRDGWGIGFFPGPRVVRRMTPKGINIGVWGRSYGSMDVNIKAFKNTSDDLDFYNTAMLWAADNIDFEKARENPEPQVWKYYAKRIKQQYPDSAWKEILKLATEILNEFNQLTGKAAPSVISLGSITHFSNTLRDYPELIKKILEYFDLRLAYAKSHEGSDKDGWDISDLNRYRERVEKLLER